LLPALAATAASAGLLGGTDAAVLATVVLMRAAAITARTAMMALAVFDLGRFVRLLSYPVAAAFLAATGALLMRSAR